MDGAAARNQQSAHGANSVGAGTPAASHNGLAARPVEGTEQHLPIDQVDTDSPTLSLHIADTDESKEPRLLRSVETEAEADSEPELGRRELEILAFERQWWKYAGAKEDAIKSALGLSATRYYQVLNAIVDRPEALRADPMLVKRLRRLRAGRQKARAARRLGFTTT